MNLEDMDLLQMQLMTYSPLTSVLQAIIARLKHVEDENKESKKIIERQNNKIKKMEAGNKLVFTTLNTKIEDLGERVDILEESPFYGEGDRETIIKEILLKNAKKAKTPKDKRKKKEGENDTSSESSDSESDKEQNNEVKNEIILKTPRLSSRLSSRASSRRSTRKEIEDRAGKEIDELLELEPPINMSEEEIGEIKNRIEQNQNNIKKNADGMDSMNIRIDNLVELIKKGTQIATNANNKAHAIEKELVQVNKRVTEAQDKALEAEAIATDSKTAVSKVTNDINSNTKRIEKLEEGVMALQKDASEAKKLAERANENSEISKQKAEKLENELKDGQHLSKEAHTAAKRAEKLAMKNAEKINKTHDKMQSIDESIKNLGDKEALADIIKNIDTTNLSKTATQKRSPTPRGDYATRKEVKLLRQVLVKCEADIHSLIEAMKNIQTTERSPRKSARGKAGKKKKEILSARDGSTSARGQSLSGRGGQKTPRKEKTKKSKLSLENLPEPQPDVLGPKGSLSSRSTQSEHHKSLLTKITGTADTASNVLPVNRLHSASSNMQNLTDPNSFGGSRDIRSEWSVNGDDAMSVDSNALTVPQNDKMYNTLAVTLNEIIGRTSVLESAVAAIQAYLDDLNLEDGMSLRSTQGIDQENLVSTQEMMDKISDLNDGISGDDYNKLVDKLNKKCDTTIVDNLMKQVQALLSQVRTLQRQGDTMATKDNTPSLKQFRDLENKMLKKVNRKELQTVVSKLLPQQNQNAPIAAFEKSDEDLTTSAKAAEDIAALKAAINAHANDISNLFKAKADKGDVFKDMSEFKETLDRHDQMKADASIVARKAEREYVDNALEKLKAELEATVGQTNAHTSNLIAKDLEFLKGLLDNKASKSDMRKLRDLLKRLNTAERKTDGGLVGYRQLKCLSCNATMENMRTKPHAMNFMNFVSHLPDPKQRLYPKRTHIVHPLTQESLQKTHNMMKNRIQSQASTTTAQGIDPHAEAMIQEDQYPDEEALPPIRQ